jgi:hypothetical protein
MSQNPKEEALDFEAEILQAEEILEKDHPNITRNKYYLAVKGFVRSQTAKKYTDAYFASVINNNVGESSPLKSGELGGTGTNR